MALTDHYCNALYEEVTKLTKDTIPLGKNVLLEILEDPRVKQRIDGLYLPQNMRNRGELENFKLMKCKIISVGRDVKEENEIEPGMTVLIDKWSCWFHPGYVPGRLALTQVENVIFVCED